MWTGVSDMKTKSNWKNRQLKHTSLQIVRCLIFELIILKLERRVRVYERS